MKSPQQLIGELDFILSQKSRPASLYFVDDNFIGNRKATREMLPHLVAWQKRNGYPLSFSCEATLNIAKHPGILAMMREARFDAVFVGIGTPERDALKAMRKEHNASLHMLEAIQTLNSYGLEVTCGIILGLDSDTVETESRLNDFVNRSQIPMLIRVQPGAPVRALYPSDREHLRQSIGDARRRPAHTIQFETRLDAAGKPADSSRPVRRLSAAVLAYGMAGHSTRTDRISVRRGLHRLSSHRILARSPSRPAECLVLFGARPGAPRP
jgi:hypothetical protein